MIFVMYMCTPSRPRRAIAVQSAENRDRIKDRPWARDHALGLGGPRRRLSALRTRPCADQRVHHEIDKAVFAGLRVTAEVLHDDAQGLFVGYVLRNTDRMVRIL